MDDREFFDKLYQMWTKTTHAEDRYWDFQKEDGDHTLHTINAVGPGDLSIPVAWGVYESDADFITALHGCFPDLYRRLHEALDEADAADYDRDERECRIYELEAEIDHLKSIIAGLSTEPPWKD